MEKKLEIRGLKKALKDTATQNIDKSPNIEKLVESAKETNQKTKEKKQELEEKRNQEGKATLALTTLLIGSLLSPLSALSLGISIMLLSSTKKIEESNRLLGQVIQAEASVRLGNTLRESLASDTAKLYSASSDDFLKLDKNVLDYLLLLSSGASFAISIRSIVPAADETLQTRVYFDTNRNLLSYRKGNSKKRYFNYNPIKNMREMANHLVGSYPNLFKHPPVIIMVVADPIIVKIERTPDFVKTVGEENYLCVDEVYVIEENRLINFIRSISGEN